MNLVHSSPERFQIFVTCFMVSVLPWVGLAIPVQKLHRSQLALVDCQISNFCSRMRTLVLDSVSDVRSLSESSSNLFMQCERL